MNDEKVQRLIDENICRSFAEARRLVAAISEDLFDAFIEKRKRKMVTFGRKPSFRTTRRMWPKDKVL